MGDSLGYVHHHLGDYRQSVDCYGQAVQRFHPSGGRHGEAAGPRMWWRHR
ncbi:hypothetical protein [Streptomyces sp. NPDC048508]